MRSIAPRFGAERAGAPGPPERGALTDERAAPSTDAVEAARVRRRFEQLLRAGVSIASRHGLPEVLKQIVESARDVVEARYAALGVLDADGAGFETFETAGISTAQREAIGQPPRGHGLLGMLIRKAKALRTPRIGGHPQSVGFPPNHPPMTAFLGVPILANGKVYGNLYLTDKVGAEEFSEEDEQVAVLLASLAATAIENARLHEESSALLEQVLAMQRQRDQFFAMINHELRNALTGVYGWAEQLRRARTPAGVERATRETFEAAERTIVLLNNLLDLSRLDAGRVQAVFRDIEVTSPVARAVAAVQPAADVKPLALTTEIPTPAPVCGTDAIRLEQILINLLSNAVRHSRPGDEVRVHVEVTGAEVLFHVIDRGPGIPLEDQVRIFEPFIRHDPESGLGSGLGLPVSRRLAEVLGGRLTVHSQLGRGATFTLVLPRGPAGSGA